jgi:hypothetical protein
MHIADSGSGRALFEMNVSPCVHRLAGSQPPITGREKPKHEKRSEKLAHADVVIINIGGGKSIFKTRIFETRM